ncbi:hypothetical protein OG777_02375 [Micromonospora peucetia]|uniref:GyrI-like small molecule binding domain-containing protein n=1 Tax=Micromonospora peucetia TaxID=47871 RepID=A0ABZ1EHA2_9ACTN|nr:hypothetical protein [Micromonospora peucetia]MCX4385776.1 hypothetical protein [Micromonospora peucetia]WSA33163.1 hypothetical protein OIE14_03550 [Micromonospora peucetia]
MPGGSPSYAGSGCRWSTSPTCSRFPARKPPEPSIRTGAESKQTTQHVVQSIGVRIEQAHREAYILLRKAQAAYPSILQAYDAVGAWLDDRGRTLSASAREVYYPHWATADDEDECVDVAFPFDPAPLGWPGQTQHQGQ